MPVPLIQVTMADLELSREDTAYLLTTRVSEAGARADRNYKSKRTSMPRYWLCWRKNCR